MFDKHTNGYIQHSYFASNVSEIEEGFYHISRG